MNILGEYRKHLDDPDSDEIRDLVVSLKEHVIGLSELADRVRLFRFFTKLGADEHQAESLIAQNQPHSSTAQENAMLVLGPCWH